MPKLPIYASNKKKGNIASSHLKTILSNFSIVNEISESVDLGIDMRAEIIEDNKPLGLFFNIQCKGKDEVNCTEVTRGYFSISIKITTINYWRQQNDVTLLFVVDNLEGKCYWCNPLEQLADKMLEIQDQDTVTIRVYLNKSIDSSTPNCPSDIRQDIILFMANQMEHVNDMLDKIKLGLTLNGTVDTKTSIELLKRISKSVNRMSEASDDICCVLIKNIRNQFHEAYKYAMQLEVIDPTIVRKWCKHGVYEETGFTKTGKSLRTLQKEIDEVIEKYEYNRGNLSLLEQLQKYDYEVEDLLKNIGVFLYEMACEDNPFGDHTELYKATFEREWKYD